MIQQLKALTLEALEDGISDSTRIRDWIACKMGRAIDPEFVNHHAWALVHLQREDRIRKIASRRYALVETVEADDLVEEVKDGQPLPAWAKTLVNSARARNRRAGFKEAFTESDLRSLWRACGGLCCISGLPFRETRIGTGKAQRAFAPSLDRLNPDEGYSRANCRLVMVAVNFAINRWGDDTYLALAEAAVQYASRHHSTGD